MSLQQQLADLRGSSPESIAAAAAAGSRSLESTGSGSPDSRSPTSGPPAATAAEASSSHDELGVDDGSGYSYRAADLTRLLGEQVGQLEGAELKPLQAVSPRDGAVSADLETVLCQLRQAQARVTELEEELDLQKAW